MAETARRWHIRASCSQAEESNDDAGRDRSAMQEVCFNSYTWQEIVMYWWRMEPNCFDVYNLRMRKGLKEETETITISNGGSGYSSRCGLRESTSP